MGFWNGRDDGKVCVNFLFATQRKKEQLNDEAHWHRWTSNKGIAELSRCHFIAVSYRFGEPASIRGWIDGGVHAGSWDMGGPTEEQPVVDDDAVWIGSSTASNSPSCLKGSLDSVAIRKALMDDDSTQQRFNRAKPLPEMPPSLEAVPGLCDK